MQRTTIPNTDLTVSRIAMGCWSLSGDATWGDQPEEDSIAAVHAAIDAGIDFFDNAEMYGNGLSEERLGKALVGRRDQVVIATKFSQENARYDDVIAACERSLRRLQTDYIDLYQVHWYNREVPLDETWRALDALREQGKVRYTGVCNFGVRDLDDALRVGRPVTDQLPYSLLFRAIEYEIVPKCLSENIGILCYSPLAIGLLTGKFHHADEVPPGRGRSRHFSKNRPLTRHGEDGAEEETFAAIAAIEKVAAEEGIPLVELALAWLLHRPGVTAVISGIRNPRQAESNAKAGDLALSEELVAKLDELTRPLKEKLGTNPDMWEGSAKSRYR